MSQVGTLYDMATQENSRCSRPSLLQFSESFADLWFYSLGAGSQMDSHFKMTQKIRKRTSVPQMGFELETPHSGD